jgi:chromosome segregation ATPase
MAREIAPITSAGHRFERVRAALQSGPPLLVPRPLPGSSRHKPGGNPTEPALGRVLLETQQRLIDSERERQLAEDRLGEMQRQLNGNRKLMARLIRERSQGQPRTDGGLSPQLLQLQFSVQDLQRQLIERECQSQLDQQALQALRERLEQLTETQDSLLEVLEAERQERLEQEAELHRLRSKCATERLAR